MSNVTPLETYKHLLLDLDKLLRAGQDDTVEYDDLTADMDRIWYDFSSDERTAARAIAAELNNKRTKEKPNV